MVAEIPINSTLQTQTLVRTSDLTSMEDTVKEVTTQTKEDQCKEREDSEKEGSDPDTTEAHLLECKSLLDQDYSQTIMKPDLKEDSSEMTMMSEGQ